MSISGTVKLGTVERVLRNVAARELTGKITWLRPGNETVMTFREGRLTGAWSQQPRRPLGEILVERRVLDPQSLRSALVRQRREPGKRIGALLCEMGAVRAGHLEAALGDQMSELVESMRSWTYGSYTFASLRPSGEPDLSIHVSDILPRRPSPEPVPEVRDGEDRRPGVQRLRRETSAAFDALDRLVERGASQDAVWNLLLDQALLYVDRALLLSLDDSRHLAVVAERSLGDDYDAGSRLARYDQRIERDSLFDQAIERRRAIVGPPPTSAAFEALYRTMAGPQPHLILIVPVAGIDEHTLFLYGDQIAQREQRSFELLEYLVRGAGLALRLQHLETEKRRLSRDIEVLVREHSRPSRPDRSSGSDTGTARSSRRSSEHLEPLNPLDALEDLDVTSTQPMAVERALRLTSVDREVQVEEPRSEQRPAEDATGEGRADGDPQPPAPDDSSHVARRLEALFSHARERDHGRG